MQNHTAESLKSLEGFDIAWVEEAQTLSDHSLTLLRPTLRKEDSEIWFSWNPMLVTDPVDKFFKEENPPDTIKVEVTYRDNPYLPNVLLREAEWDRKRDAEKFAHVWLGKHKRSSEARIFKNWRVEEIETPHDVSRLFGADWGFAIDPNVLVSSWFHPNLPRTLVIDFEAYEIGCEIEDTPDMWDGLFCHDEEGKNLCPVVKSECKRPTHGQARKWVITGDSARPETISYMKRHGYPRLVPSKKGPTSVLEGVQFLQGYDIIVHPRCVHTIDELTFYSYKTDKLTGQVLPIISDKKNHVIDSIRYGAESTRAEAKKKGGLVF
jgi:Phage terminase large subunit